MQPLRESPLRFATPPPDPRFCLHSMSIAKRWQENGKWFAILRCRRYGCDHWTRKSIVLDQDSRKGLKMKTEKFEENNTEKEAI
jgi:hypothetical protein